MFTSLFQQAPIRNESIEGYKVYSHSGEFAPNVTDLTIPGRGLSFELIRTYRAHPRHDNAFGHGWSFTYAKRVEREGDGILYHDGEGRTHRLHRDAQSHHYSAPHELYAVLTIEGEKIVLRQPSGLVFVFEDFDDGGHLLVMEDRNGNTLRFERASHALRVIDPLGHVFTFHYHQHRIVDVQDYAGRTWHYRYDNHNCLVEVVQPPIPDFPQGPSIKYGYDHSHRLISVTDANGQPFLHNHYDDKGRIAR
jgi:hypothetical protein